MANALQEQLLKAGLASKQKARDVKTQKRKQKKAKIDDGSAALKQQIAQQKLEQAAKDKALNEQRFAEASEKGQVRGLITEFTKFAIKAPAGGEIKFNFTVENKILSVYVDEKLQGQLQTGVVGIVRFEDKSYIVPHKLAERVNLLVPEWCGYLWQESADNQVEQASEENDPYADYAIPDDLMW
ncbi:MULTISPECIES: DUF2058 domain-containing protein [unclassified Shewanella]|uniref:DUF2058 domain-containing protein n=1 Tax=unclassified Shewanella TaxID=196818 RepID=UPI000C852186|nr:MULTISPECIES: DUF2058 domain-containing protein [unclassified Shewanella]MDO6620109.1 DUF2058 domain-containing protein [Shewanella sp. 6_MG-2023]MDO6640519.1 DUF2058 domain-containing protein [Shewanella sp. 5_MG-2023]MDO6678830.1 DUF2058 domain-containing protein [Shewanella sp. 4_MG-2023]MDO6776196.1 DUF2058 domain-containing protein [Shewanella sp. 3_MG-2023]PMG28510.1 hypothetical protein BCU94_17665 [Shewanella sp. 10N.286.52.C2]